MEPATGDLLASVSYPWPETMPPEAVDPGLVDRIRAL